MKKISNELRNLSGENLNDEKPEKCQDAIKLLGNIEKKSTTIPQIKDVLNKAIDKRVEQPRPKNDNKNNNKNTLSKRMRPNE